MRRRLQGASLPRARAVVRVWSASVSVSVSRLCALLVLPSFVNFGGQVQVKSKSGRIRKSHPAWPQSPYWPSPPPDPISFPAHHQGEPNSPGFPFPFDQRPESWLILTAWDLTLSAKNSIPKVLTVLTWTLNPPTASSSSSCRFHWLPSISTSSLSSSSSLTLTSWPFLTLCPCVPS